MKVTVDPLICEANGICMDIAPQVFSLDDDDVLHVRDPAVRPETEALIRSAVAGCPRAALTVQE